MTPQDAVARLRAVLAREALRSPGEVRRGEERTSLDRADFEALHVVLDELDAERQRSAVLDEYACPEGHIR